MPNLMPPSLDHLRTVLAVVDEGSFGAAARRLGRSVSVVSYAVAQVEHQLDLTLFEREGSRKPVLTAKGRALLAEMQTISEDYDGLLSRVRSLRQGLEAELPLVVDVMVPGPVLARLLRDFQQRFPRVALHLNVEALGAVAAMLLDERASLAIAGPDIPDLPELEREVIGAVEMVPVASPDHPLARQDAIAPGEAGRHLQLVLTDRSSLTQGRDSAVMSPRTWGLADLGAKHALLREGIGWGAMPRNAVAADIALGTLVELALPERATMTYPLLAMWRRDHRPGPAAAWVLDELRQRLSGQPGSDSL